MTDVAGALEAAEHIGYPVLVRPSYVLGGRSMEIVYDADSLSQFMERALKVSPDHPILIDQFLEDAIEVDVDAISDGTETVVAGIMEHIEEAGIHSGDSACVLPTMSFSEDFLGLIESQTERIAQELRVIGLMNIQYAVKEGILYVLEVNPRASRTVPFVSKAIGVPLAKLATKVMLGRSLKELGFTEAFRPAHVSVKEAVFPFNRFPNAEIVLGPEMRSTGEVMGIDSSFGLAFAKSQMAVGFSIPRAGRVFISVHDIHKEKITPIARRFGKWVSRSWPRRERQPICGKTTSQRKQSTRSVRDGHTSSTGSKTATWPLSSTRVWAEGRRGMPTSSAAAP